MVGVSPSTGVPAFGSWERMIPASWSAEYSSVGTMRKEVYKSESSTSSSFCPTRLGYVSASGVAVGAGEETVVWSDAELLPLLPLPGGFKRLHKSSAARTKMTTRAA